MRIHFVGIALIVALISIQANAEQLPAPHAIVLERNVEKFLTLDFPIRRLTIGNTEIVDVSIVDGMTLRLLGLVSGTTNFSLWRNNSGEPEVFTVSVGDGVTALTDRLDVINKNSVRISDLGGKIVIEGEFTDALSQSDTRELAKFVTGKDVLDLSDVRTKESVEVEVEVVTVSKTALRGLGINLSRIGNDFSVVSAVIRFATRSTSF